MTNLAIKTEHICKCYPQKRSLKDYLLLSNKKSQVNQDINALKDINLSIHQGEFFGLLGPNGSGKTTLQKIICGLLLPDSGIIRLFGDNLHDNHAIKRTKPAYVFDGERSFYWRLTGQQNLEFFAAMSGAKVGAVRRQIADLAQQFQLEEHLSKQFSSFSSGNRQKMSIIRALLTNPDVLVMDEPTRSLDPEVANQLYLLMKDLVRQNQTTVLWATHNLTEAEEICDRIAILHKGRILSELPAVGVKDTYFRLMQPVGQVELH